MYGLIGRIDVNHHHNLRQDRWKGIFSVVVATHKQEVPGAPIDRIIRRSRSYLRLVAAPADRVDELRNRLLHVLIVEIIASGKYSANQQEEGQKNSQGDTRGVAPLFAILSDFDRRHLRDSW